MSQQAVIYTRVSTNEQAELGISLQAQHNLAQSYANFRQLHIIETISESGISGSIPLSKRPGGKRLLQLVAQPNITAVIAHKLDRVFRDAADCLAVTKHWDELGVNLHLVDIGGQPIDTSSPMGRFFLTIMAGVAEMERNLIVKRTQVAMDQLKVQGKRTGAVPYGFQLADDQKTLIPNSIEQEAIALAKRLHQQGLSLRKIAHKLDLKGYRARNGRPFYAQQIKRIIQTKTR